ncbi:DNA glycosylase AlkZ-like family protein [Haloarchaeobius amylolyticus]|uniref:DNA glycosylase AlkZ-like family protein n=1 Tax=Haloarchaeobius amylolyticus TaxID=1198296 RepID=UPI00226F3540|nr:crosslink repair DNA glycosylase YcaQ family protein [Haloarchaeobius amylolyticus]
MQYNYSPAEVRRARLRSQSLVPEAAAQRVEQVTENVCGLQAQQPLSAALGVRARSSGLTLTAVERARIEERTVLRTWCVRGTMHLVSTNDVPWMLSAFGPVFSARSRSRLDDLGFNAATCEEAIEVIKNAIHEYGHLTRFEIVDVLQNADLEFDPDGQAPHHLIRQGALRGVFCEVSPKDGREAYGLLEEWVGIDDFPDRGPSLEILDRRYLSAYQPATIDDFASWSKLPMIDVRWLGGNRRRNDGRQRESKTVTRLRRGLPQ